MVCNCNEDRLILLIKQGEDKSFTISIKDRSGVPISLDGKTIEVDVKMYPLYKVKSIFTKTITSNPVDGSYISDADNGKFILKINIDDTKDLPPANYYLVITLINGNGTKTIISGEGDKSGVLKVCNQ